MYFDWDISHSQIESALRVYNDYIAYQFTLSNSNHDDTRLDLDVQN